VIKRIGICVLIGICCSFILFAFLKIADKRASKNQLYNAELKIKIGNSSADKSSVATTLSQIKKRFDIDYDLSAKQLNKSDFLLSIKKVEDTSQVKKVASESMELKFLETFSITDLANPLTEIEKELSKRRKQLNGTSDSLDKYEFLLEDVDIENKKKNGVSSLAQLISFSTPYQDMNGGLRYPGALGLTKVKDTIYLNKLFKDEKIRGFLPENLFFGYGKSDGNPSLKDSLLNFYAIRMPDSILDPFPTDENIEDCRQDFEPLTAAPIITMKFDTEGSNYWYILTKRNIGKPIAILANDFVLTAPSPESAIQGGESRISGNFTVEEAKNLAGMIRAGRLASRVEVIESKFIPRRGSIRTWMLALIFILSTGMAFGISFLIKPASKP